MKTQNKYITYISGSIHALLKGAGQTVFQASALAGILIITGLAAASLSIGGEGYPSVFAGGISALAVASAMAFAIKIKDWQKGLYGFNAMLVGCATFTFFNADAWAWSLAMTGALLTLPVKLLLDRLLKNSSYTLPFVFITWLILVLGTASGVCTAHQAETASEPLPGFAASMATGVSKGISEIFLADSWVAGIIFIAALAVADIKAAAWALIGSAGGMLLAYYAGCPYNETTAGLWGFSPALTAIATGTVLPIKKHRIALAVTGIALTFLIQYLTTPELDSIGLPVLTMPFCIATILCASISRTCIK